MTDFANGALRLDITGDIATLTFNRPERRNALNAAQWIALGQACAAIDASPEAKVVIVRGEGGHFAAGADISEFDTVYATRESSAHYADLVHDNEAALANLDRPVIAAIDGFCVGAGSAIALACDIRIGAADAKFGITPAKLGLMYNLADTKRLIDTVGPGRAKDILFTGRLLDADEALAFGLIDFVVPAGQPLAAAQAKATLIAGNSQWSTRSMKRVMRQVIEGVADDTDQTRDWFVDAVQADDFKEGRAAFMAKRAPDFRYR
jgi:enoyl-CoA hydratase/carnithine racemase